MESSKNSVAAEGKGSTVCADRHAERRALAVADRFYGACLPGFLWPVIFALPGSESVFDVSQGPPLCACSSLNPGGLWQRDFTLTSLTMG